MLQNILTLRCKCRHQDWGASLISPSIFQGAGARLKMQLVFCANMSACSFLAVWEMTEKVAAATLSPRGKSPCFQPWA